PPPHSLSAVYDPTSYIRPAGDAPSISSSAPVMSNAGGGEYYEVLADYTGKAGDPRFLKVNKGDNVKMIKKDAGWSQVENYGQQGLVPTSYLKQSSGGGGGGSSFSQTVPFTSQATQAQQQRSQTQQVQQSAPAVPITSSSGGSIPPPPPVKSAPVGGSVPPPPPVTKKADTTPVVAVQAAPSSSGGGGGGGGDLADQLAAMKRKMEAKEKKTEAELEQERERRPEPKSSGGGGGGGPMDLAAMISMGRKNLGKQNKTVAIDKISTSKTVSDVSSFKNLHHRENTDDDEPQASAPKPKSYLQPQMQHQPQAQTPKASTPASNPPQSPSSASRANLSYTHQNKDGASDSEIGQLRQEVAEIKSLLLQMLDIMRKRDG
ncbi:MAG: hypothetical protein EZS28_039694, partial [Streblomastix strix]